MEKLNARDKFLYLNFPPVKILGEEVLIRIPYAHEAGQLFPGLAIAFADAAWQQDRDEVLHWESLKEWGSVFLESHAPMDAPFEIGRDGSINFAPTNALGVLPKLAMELMMNTKSYWKTPVVSPTLEGLPPHEQYSEYTTEAAKFLGRTFNQSPAQIDHALNSILGPAASDFLRSGQSLDELFTGKRFKTASDWPILGRVFRRGGTVGVRPKPIDELYDRAAFADMRSRSRETPETEQQKQERMLLHDATRAISLMLHIRNMTNDESAQRSITKKAGELAEQAKEALDIMYYHRDPFRLEEAARSVERDQMKMFKAMEEGRTEEAETLRKKLFKAKQNARAVLQRKIPDTIDSTRGASKRRRERRYQRKRARARLKQLKTP